ncbi:MAG: protocatechuate 3,4-dioxygenase beta subunit [Bradymonadia bacterium]|jgi:protocatechuate 3,4-dioxygenase beta subunit
MSTLFTQPIHRRAVLGGILISPLALLGCAKAKTTPRVLTAAQTRGPFYPSTPPRESDADLTRLAGQPRAQGAIIEVRGRVIDLQGRPLPGAQVELWQANAAGRYNHPADRASSGALDAGFQGWGKVIANGDGGFRFLSIVPGSYLAARDWRRPPHLHFKIGATDGRTVTTQTYFGGDALNAKDGILQALSAAEQRGVIIDFKPGDSGAQVGHVDFILPARA